MDLKKIGLMFLSICFYMLCGLALAAELKVLIRYDDYNQYSNIHVEQYLFETVKSLGAGVLVGVIPFPGHDYPLARDITNEFLKPELSDDKIDLLKEYVSQGVVEVAIHGFRHKSNVTNGPSSEFAGLSESTQLKLLKVAKSSLEQAAGINIKAFIPPYNQYDAATLDALQSTEVLLLSAGLGGVTDATKNIKYLPGGPYPYRLKDIVLSAVKKGHTDALITTTIHPYDIIESDSLLPDFRGGLGQINLAQLSNDLAQIKNIDHVEFTTVNKLFDSGEDLSSSRFESNIRLRNSWVTTQRLLPGNFGMFPLTGLFYAKHSADRMYWSQIAAALALYGGLLLVIYSSITKLIIKATQKHRTAFYCIVISLLGFSIIALKAVLTGFYLTSAIGVTLCAGLFTAAFVQRASNRQYLLQAKVNAKRAGL